MIGRGIEDRSREINRTEEEGNGGTDVSDLEQSEQGAEGKADPCG